MKIAGGQEHTHTFIYRVVIASFRFPCLLLFDVQIVEFAQTDFEMFKMQLFETQSVELHFF